MKPKSKLSSDIRNLVLAKAQSYINPVNKQVTVEDDSDAEERKELRKATEADKKRKQEKRKLKRQKIKEARDRSKKKDLSEAKKLAINYLHLWNCARDMWSFKKKQQYWLLDNVYDTDNVSEENFKILLNYLVDLKGVARSRLISESEKVVKKHEEKSADGTTPLYMSPVQTECINLDYYIPQNQENENTKRFTDQRWERIHMARSVIGMYIVGFFFIFISFFTGVAGCWKRSKGNILATGLLQMLAALVDAGAMGLWHGVHYYDYQKLTDEMSYYNWPDVLKMNGVTQFYYGWSYILAWIGVGMCLLTAILFLGAACCVVHEKKLEQAKNMQYLMPVYPDKRQPYGYGYAYPGPYYTHGSQYGGPYSY